MPAQNNDVKVIQSAYEEELKGLFHVLNINASGENMDVAVERFSKGLVILREACDRAKKIV